jgi:hypothetical protein
MTESGKIFLRRTANHTFNPYTLETDRVDYVPSVKLGDIVILPSTPQGDYVFGLSRRGRYAIHMALGIARNHNELTDKVYESVKAYGERLANSMPDSFVFVDETCGAKKIKLPLL